MIVSPYGRRPLDILRSFRDDILRSFRDDFVQASARVIVTDDAVEVRFGKRAHNPYLLAAGFANTDVTVPWWMGRRLRLAFC